MTAANPAEAITFVCCVESGPLEPMTLLLLGSLRRWGGAFAGCRFVAVNPRFGPPLRRATRRRLEELGGEYLALAGRNEHAWFQFFNKPHAITAVEERAATPLVAWLDSDILVLKEPTLLLLGPDEDFAACASDKNIGSTGPDDPFDRYWRKVAELFGLDVDSFPWVATEEERARIRLYWNSGVFVWRRSTGFARHYLADCTCLLESKVASAEAGIYFTDQVTLGITMLRQQLRWRALPYEYNYPISDKIVSYYDPVRFRAARLLHYHNALWPRTWDETLRRLKEEHPAFHDWLAPHGPLSSPTPWPQRALGKLLRTLRDRRVRTYEALCQRF